MAPRQGGCAGRRYRADCRPRPRRRDGGMRARNDHARTVEQVRPDRGAQARQARPRGAAEERHHRHPRPCRRAGSGEIRRPASRYGDRAAGALRHTGVEGADPEASRRYQRAARSRAPARRSRRHGHRRADDRAAAAAMLLHGAARYRGESRTDRQRRHRRILRQISRSPQGLRLGADAGRPGSGQGARALRQDARFHRRRGLDQCRRQGIVRPGLRAVLEQGRRARRVGDDPSQRLHRRHRASSASISTTSSAIRWRRRSRCIT